MKKRVGESEKKRLFGVFAGGTAIHDGRPPRRKSVSGGEWIGEVAIRERRGEKKKLERERGGEMKDFRGEKGVYTPPRSYVRVSSL